MLQEYPAGQGVHASALAREYLPEGHVVGTAVVEAHAEPLGQAVHTPEDTKL